TLIDESEIGRHGRDRLARCETPPSFLETSVQMVGVEGKAVRVLKPARQLKATHPGDGRQFAQRDIRIDVILAEVSNATQHAIAPSRSRGVRWLTSRGVKQPKTSMQQFVRRQRRGGSRHRPPGEIQLAEQIAVRKDGTPGADIGRPTCDVFEGSAEDV